MPGNVIISIDVPEGYCYESPQADWPYLVSLLTANLSGSLSPVNSGSSTPSAANRDRPWLRSNSDGSDDGQWTFYGGFWVQKHPIPQGFVMFAPTGTTAAQIDALDGGETAAVSNMTGPFWEIVTELAARSPMGPGTLPSGTIVNSGDSLGEEKHQLTLAELPEANTTLSSEDGQQILAQVTSNAVSTINRTGSLDYGFADPPAIGGSDDPHNTVHPVYAIYAIRRTARLYRRRNP